MEINPISDFDKDQDNWNLGQSNVVHWNGKQLKVLDREENNGASHVKAVFDRLSSTRIKPMGSVGGGVSADKDYEGNAEVTAEVHVSTKSEDGNTTVSASGQATIDNAGNTSGKVEVKFEHEF